MGFMDKIKQKADEYDLQGKADKLSEGIEKTSKQAVEKAGALAHDNRDRITSGLDRAGAKFDAQTDGKYTDKVTKAKQMAAKGVEKVAEQRPGSAGGAVGATGAATPGTPGTPYVAPVVPPQDASPFTTPDAGATPPAGPQDPSI